MKQETEQMFFYFKLNVYHFNNIVMVSITCIEGVWIWLAIFYR
jgi:hypothetical protein